MVSMAVTQLISVEEYLSTEYSPDRDFVDGVLEDRNVGERDHGELQEALLIWFYLHTRQLGLRAYPEQRVQVSASRYRLPDVCLTLGRPDEQIFTKPPFVCIEILSPRDQFGRVLAKVSDYLTFGVPYVWVIDPRERKATIYTAGGSHVPEDGILRTENPDIALPLAEL
jgi:Uma2 family endonuclease